MCSAGFYCVSSAETSTPTVGPTVGDECPRGFYCPEGTEVPIACPIGSFSINVRLGNASECVPCLAGHFCDQSAAVFTSGLCVEGYYCPEGSTSNTSESCCPGHYCPEGTPVPLPCPTGTYSSSTNLSHFSQCLPCTPGFYCEGHGLTQPMGPCDGDVYCPAGSTNACPFNVTCPIGHVS